MTLRFGSLFSGIGGLDLGLERAGMECRWQIEIEPFCRSVLELHWPEIKRYDDIRTVRGTDLEPVDLIAGGFPCQDVSQAGKRTGLFDADGAPTRSGLWLEFARLVRELRPRYVLAENTPGLLTLSGTMARVVRDLAGCGYVGCNLCLRASDFGGAHLRKRVFIIATRIDGDGSELAYSANGARGIPTQYSADLQRDVSRQSAGSSSGELGSNLAYSEHSRLLKRGAAHNGDGRNASWNDANRCDLADTECAGLEIGDGQREELLRQDAEPFAPGLLPFAPGPNDPRWPAILANRPDLAPALESAVRGVADGPADRLDRTEIENAMNNRTRRLKALGNAVVPQCAEWIGRRILEVA